MPKILAKNVQALKIEQALLMAYIPITHEDQVST